MDRGPWKIHTHWTWKPADPIRHIYLEQHRQTRVWLIRASNAMEPWEKQFAQFSDAMRVIEAMVERTGGPKQWLRRGPEVTGSQFS